MRFEGTELFQSRMLAAACASSESERTLRAGQSDFDFAGHGADVSDAFGRVNRRQLLGSSSPPFP